MVHDLSICCVGCDAKNVRKPTYAFSFWCNGRKYHWFFCNGNCLRHNRAKLGSKEVLFLMTGILGGFTTFSTFSLDAFRLWEPIIMGLAVGYVTISVALSVLALCAGIIFVRGGNA